MTTAPVQGTTYAIGVDIGGTFTDCVLLGSEGTIVGAKSPTTPNDRSEGFFNSIAEAGDRVGLSVGELFARTSRIVHGTTTGTNAIVSRAGAAVGLITTAGHGDIMFIMRGGGRTAGLSPDEALRVHTTYKPDPIVPKTLIAEIPERIDIDGDVVVPLDEVATREAIQRVIGAGAEAIAISLLWSFRNPRHERRVRELVREIAPDMFVSCASDLVAQIGEYERTTTAVMNAYIGPLMNRYVNQIVLGARERGFDGHVLFAQCGGGAITAEEARSAPILTVQSGPVAGIVSSALLCKQLGFEDALLADMGGTTFDVSVIRHGDPIRRRTSVFQRYELALPMLDVESVGAGGGSLVWTDESGRLNVGPQSAGAFPGPACYEKGNDIATVTDADVTLGVIDPSTFLDGRMKISGEAAERSIATVAEQFSLSVPEIAAGVNRLVDAKMADLIRRMSVMRGLDPRKFVMLAFGGGGPVHACAVAREAGVGRVIIPLPHVAAMWSALGAALSDVTHSFSTPLELTLPLEGEELREVFATMQKRARDTFNETGFEGDEPTFQYTVRMKYAAQVLDVEVPISADHLQGDVSAKLADTFADIYIELFGKGSGYAAAGIEITDGTVHATVATPKPEFRRVDNSVATPVTRTTRNVHWAEAGTELPTSVLRLKSGVVPGAIPGPALIELPDTVVVVGPHDTAHFDEFGNIIVDIG